MGSIPITRSPIQTHRSLCCDGFFRGIAGGRDSCRSRCPGGNGARRLKTRPKTLHLGHKIWGTSRFGSGRGVPKRGLDLLLSECGRAAKLDFRSGKTAADERGSAVGNRICEKALVTPFSETQSALRFRDVLSTDASDESLIRFLLQRPQQADSLSLHQLG